jgi:hypothetical protein
MHYDNLQLYRNKKQKKYVPTLLLSVLLMQWQSIFHKCNLVQTVFLSDMVGNIEEVLQKADRLADEKKWSLDIN